MYPYKSSDSPNSISIINANDGKFCEPNYNNPFNVVCYGVIPFLMFTPAFFNGFMTPFNFNSPFLE